MKKSLDKFCLFKVTVVYYKHCLCIIAVVESLGCVQLFVTP